MTILGKYCGNTYKYWPNTWKMCSPASAIFMSIDTILVSFWAILIHFKASCWSITLELTSKVDNYRNPFQIPSKTYKYCANTCEYYTCRWTHFSSIGSILVSIITILAEYCHNTCKYWAGEYTPGGKNWSTIKNFLFVNGIFWNFLGFIISMWVDFIPSFEKIGGQVSEI